MKNSGAFHLAAADDTPPPSDILESIAKLIEQIPVVGPFVAEFLRAPKALQRLLIWSAVIFIIYPFFIVVGVLWAIPHLPDAPEGWVRSLGDNAFDIPPRLDQLRADLNYAMRLKINRDHAVIDGSTLLDFEVAGSAPPATYIEQVSLNQPVSLLTYQEWEGATNGKNCVPGVASGDRMGTLTMSPVGAETVNPFKVMYSHEDFSHVMSETGATPVQRTQALSGDDWKTLGIAVAPSDGQTSPGAIDVRLQFTPEAALWKNPDCRFKIYILMTYRKPLLK